MPIDDDQAAAGIGTKAAYARHRGVGKSAVSNWLREGKLVAPAVLPDGRVDFALADQMLAEALNPATSRKPGGLAALGGGATVHDLNAARSRKEQARAELAEMELARQRGELVDRASVDAMGRRLGVLVQQVLEGHGRDVVDALRVAPTAAEAQHAWGRVVRGILTRIADEAQRELAKLDVERDD